MPAMTVATDSPFTAEELEPTLRPLHEASLLPARAYTDESVAASEAQQLLPRRLDVRRPRVHLRGARRLPDGRDLGRELLSRRRPRLLQRLPPPRRAARHRARGHERRLQCPYHAWSYGFDGSLQNAPHTDELEDFDPACNGLRQIRTETLGGLVFADASGKAPRLPTTWATLAEHLAAYRNADLKRAAGSTTTSRRTGRPSSRTTPSACTAPACTRSSTAQQLHDRATTTRARAPGAADR